MMMMMMMMTFDCTLC